MVIETQRLLLRELTQDDWDDLAQILQDPAVMYAYEHTFSDQDVQAWLDRQLGRYRQYGFGLWAVVERSSRRMIGQAGLTMQPHRDSEVLEVGYLLKRSAWHQGYAREAAAACRDYAFERLGRDSVHAVIKADNLPSIRVAEQLGMRRIDTFLARYYSGDRLHYLYAVHR